MTVAVHVAITSQAFATLEKGRELGQKCVPKWSLGSLFGTSRSAIGQFPSLSLVTVPQFFAKVESVQFPIRSIKNGECDGCRGRENPCRLTRSVALVANWLRKKTRGFQSITTQQCKTQHALVPLTNKQLWALKKSNYEHSEANTPPSVFTGLFLS